MPSGTAFIKHEFDEAIAIQETICECGETLSQSHPVADVRRQIESQLKTDRRHLEQLRKLGEPLGATGKREEVAEGLSSLAEETSKKAGSEESDAYEAQAVLLNLKRKQQDSADALIKIARDRGDDKMRDAAVDMRKEIKEGADELGKSLAEFAVQIASSNGRS